MARVRHGQGRGLPRRSARGAADVRGGHRRDLPARALGSAVQPHARRQDRPAAVRRAHAQPRRGAGPTRVLRGRPNGPHDPADAVPAVRQEERSVLQRVLRAGPADGRRRMRRRRGVRARDGRAPRVPLQGRPVRHRRLRPDVQGLLQRAHADGRRPRGAVPSRAAARGHGVLPVPPDRRLQDGHPAFGGGPRRGRHPAEQRGRALHGALRADRQGPRPPRHGEPRDLPGDQGGSRRRPQARRGVARRPPPAARGDRGEAARRDRVRPRLPRRRADHRARPDPADRALRDGRHPDQRRRAGRRRRGRDAGPGPVRGRRMRVRLGPRREPAGDELAARHRGVRTPRRRRTQPGSARRPTCPSSPNAPRGWSARWSTAC